MRMILAAAAIGAIALLPVQALAQEDMQAPVQADSTPGQLDNATDDDQPAAQTSDAGNYPTDAFPDSTRIPEPSESGPPIDTAPVDTARTDAAQAGDEPH
jgi:hypothetical protein